VAIRRRKAANTRAREIFSGTAVPILANCVGAQMPKSANAKERKCQGAIVRCIHDHRQLNARRNAENFAPSPTGIPILDNN
jgi:hypothetical protein